MPELDEISYSRESTIAAVRDYYTFLTKMYLKESVIVEPPEGGWPDITAETLKDLGKTDEVIQLLRHLPYISDKDGSESQAIPKGRFADWLSSAQALEAGRTTADALRTCSEIADSDAAEHIPPHVIGLTSGGRDNPVFLLDTELGIIHWYDCFSEVRNEPVMEQVLDDPYDYAEEDEQEAEWRADAPAWAVADFFEELKTRFRELHFVPVSPRDVTDIWIEPRDSRKAYLDMIRAIYREHHWPDLERFDKRECHEAIRDAVKENYPDQAWVYRSDDDII